MGLISGEPWREMKEDKKEKGQEEEDDSDDDNKRQCGNYDNPDGDDQ